MRVGFLMNHYATHQVAHSAPIAFAMSQLYPASDVLILSSHPALLAAARAIGQNYPGHRVRFVRMKISFAAFLIEKLAGKLFFVRKKSTLRSNLDLFQSLDIVVVPEKNSLALKDNPALRHLKFVRIRHGAGDRETGLDKSNARFDLILASGQKMVDRLVNTHIVDPDRCRIVGYPKFDLLTAALPQPIFNNGRPTVLYNPHFQPHESSWIKMGMDVLDFFCRHPEYNLIFAPHVMLYKRGLRHGARSLGQYKSCSNIHIDTGSAASMDMTYTRQADIYLGDVSSQIYEFLQRPRPCIFLNAHHIDWEDNINFSHWKTGQVVNSVSDLSVALKQAIALQFVYQPIQEKLFSYTFNLTDQSSAIRAAHAILAI